MSNTPNPQVPTAKFDSKVTAVIERLTAAFNSLKRINPSYGISPDEAFVFDQPTFDEFTRKVCEHHYKCIYSKNGISLTFKRKVKGDFLDAVIVALAQKSSSERLTILVDELKRLKAK